MANPARERVSIDLRDLGPALRAHAEARHLTVADVARLAVAAVLESSGHGVDVQQSAQPDAVDDKPVKLGVRLRGEVAARLSARARACGLSYGAYLTTLMEEAPAPPLEVVTALRSSTDQLAVVSSDLNQLMRTLQRGASAPGPLVDAWLRPLVNEVRQHVGIASRLVSALRPARELSRRQDGPRPSDQGPLP